MYCTACGRQIDEIANFCPVCGKQTAKGMASQWSDEIVPGPQMTLTRYLPKKMIAGVCAGVAKYLNVDVAIVRLVWVALLFFPIPGALIAYILAWIILPVEREPVRMGYPMPAAM